MWYAKKQIASAPFRPENLNAVMKWQGMFIFSIYFFTKTAQVEIGYYFNTLIYPILLAKADTLNISLCIVI